MATVVGNGKLRVASLFCGCGGMDVGIRGGFGFLGQHYGELPFEIAYAVDNDPYATTIYNDNFEHPCQTQDVRDLVPAALPQHDILLGGFPCQSFSISAQNPPRLGYSDDRGKLFFEMVNVLREKQPRFFIGENVKGLLSANKGQAFPMIISEFEKAGYHIKYKLLNASEYGVPQKRERVFIVGFKDIADYDRFEFPEATTLNGSKAKLREVIDLSANLDDKWFFSERAVAGMMRVREKMNKGRGQDLDQPCNTVSSHLAKVSLNSTDPVLLVEGRYRRFTPREAANIQSFPESFKLGSVSEARQYRAIGNAVPPVLMWHVARAVISCCVDLQDLKKGSKLEKKNRKQITGSIVEKALDQ